MKRLLLLGLAVGVALGALFWSTRAAPAPEHRAMPRQEPVEPSPPAAVAAPETLQDPTHRAPVLEPPGPSAAAEDAWPFRVHTKRLGGQREAVPHVPFEAGIGSPVDPGVAPILFGETDGEGLAEVGFPRAALEAARTSGEPVWFRVASAGFQSRVSHIFMQRLKEPHTVNLVAAAGCSVVGRLVDGEGAPVGGSVRATEVGSRGGRRPSSTHTTARLDGWFRLDVREAGVHHVAADAGEAGSAALRDQVLECALPRQVLELVARGPGVVRGRVLGAGGAPASAVVLLVVSTEVVDALATHVPYDAAQEFLQQGRGRAFEACTTDAHGAFEVRGLADGEYFVRARRLDEAGHPHLLTPRPVPAGGPPLELRFTRPHLAVEIRDASGAPWTGELGPPGNPYTWLSEDFPWPARLEVVVSAPGDAAHHDEAGKRRRIAQAWGGNRAVFEVEDGRDYLVGLLGPGQAWRPVLVSVPEGADRVEVVCAKEDSATGELELSVAGTDPEDLVVRLEDPLTGALLLARSDLWNAKWPLTFAVPAGSYRLSVEEVPMLGMHGDLLRPASLGRFEAAVQVLEGGTTPVHAELSPGARLHLRLEGEVHESDRRGIQRRFAGMTYDLEHHAARPTLALLRPSSWPLQVSFQMKSESWGAVLEHTLPIGTDALSGPLPAGRFTLHAQMPGGRTATAPVTLVAGETTTITLSFE